MQFEIFGNIISLQILQKYICKILIHQTIISKKSLIGISDHDNDSKDIPDAVKAHLNRRKA